MTIAAAVLQGGLALPAASTAFYTCPTATKAVVKRAVFVNTSASTVTLTVAVVRSGGSSLALISAQPLSAGQAYTAPELANFVLSAGDVLNTTTSTGAVVNGFASGFTM